MIAVQTNESLYIVDMELSEFLTCVSKDGLNSSRIHAKIAANVSSNKYLYMISAVVPKIECHICQTGDSFQIKAKSFSSIDEFQFYEVEGKQYSCKEAYVLSGGKDVTPTEEEKKEPEEKDVTPIEEEKKEPETRVESPETTPVLNPELTEIYNPEIVEETSKKKRGRKKAPQLKETEPVEAPAKENPAEEIPNPEEVAPEPVEETKVEPTEKPAVATPEEGGTLESVESLSDPEETSKFIPVSKRERTVAKMLDGNLQSRPSLLDLGEQVVDSVRRFVTKYKKEFDQHVCQVLGIAEDRISEFQTEYGVQNALGTSQNLLDSALVFPTFTTIAMKKRVSLDGSKDDRKLEKLESTLAKSIFVRVCPIGLEDGKVQGYFQQIPISQEDIEAAKEWLKEQKIDFRKVRRTEDKIALYEQALEIYYTKKGLNVTSGKPKKIDPDIEESLDKLERKYYVGEDSAWHTYRSYIMDARVKPLTEQLEEISKTPKDAPVVEETLEEVTPVIKVTSEEEAPVIRVTPEEEPEIEQPAAKPEAKTVEIEPATPITEYEEHLRKLREQSERELETDEELDVTPPSRGSVVIPVEEGEELDPDLIAMGAAMFGDGDHSVELVSTTEEKREETPALESQEEEEDSFEVPIVVPSEEEPKVIAPNPEEVVEIVPEEPKKEEETPEKTPEATSVIRKLKTFARPIATRVQNIAMHNKAKAKEEPTEKTSEEEPIAVSPVTPVSLDTGADDSLSLDMIEYLAKGSTSGSFEGWKPEDIEAYKAYYGEEPEETSKHR